MLAANGPNAEQIKHWNEIAGPRWVAQQALIDAQIRALGRCTMDRGAVRAGERVLDVGCGCGNTIVELAQRVGPTGSVTGVDVSTPMIEEARTAVRMAGLTHVSLIHADAQTAEFPAGAFDLIYSRFGGMFFADPVAAFANLHVALRPGGRLAMVCWRTLRENPWMFVPLTAAGRHIPLPAPAPPEAPGPFAFADSSRVRVILSTAGFSDIVVERADDQLAIGGGKVGDDAVAFLLQVGPVANALRAAPPDAQARVAAAVKEAIADFETPTGVTMPGAVWIVTACA